ncbi:hypothetical protein CFP56_010972 [Quercus suber]|uniref:Uncharacterized protein n=1 Tax=Quercus suber TaxID=58331 RepID=A0AAW0KZI2_QUESU
MAEEHEDETLRFQVSGEWVFKFQGNGFLTVFKLDFGEEHEDEDDTGCWGRTRFGIVRVSFPDGARERFMDCEDKDQ